MTTFRVGERVVCVDDKIGTFVGNGDMGGLAKGRIYTVRGVGSHTVTNRLGLLLCEIVRHPCDETFDTRRFRKLVTGTQEQDVATFLHIANHIDPIIRADEYRQEMEESEARLERLWTAMRSFEL